MRNSDNIVRRNKRPLVQRGCSNGILFVLPQRIGFRSSTHPLSEDHTLPLLCGIDGCVWGSMPEIMHEPYPATKNALGESQASLQLTSLLSWPLEPFVPAKARQCRPPRALEGIF